MSDVPVKERRSVTPAPTDAALKRRGVPVEMIVYPRQPHGFREPRFIRDLADRNLAWMNRFVRDGGASASR